MTAAADQTGMSPAMKKQLAVIMEDPQKLSETMAKLKEAASGEKTAGKNYASIIQNKIQKHTSVGFYKCLAGRECRKRLT